MAYVRVAYLKRDRDFDYVPGHRLTTLIAQDEISHFFRPAEKRWVSVKFDALRGEGGEAYQGPERRRNDHTIRAVGEEVKNSYFCKGVSGKDWLGGLWRQIESS